MANRGWSWDQVEDGTVTVTPRTDTVWLCLDGAVQRELEQLQTQIAAQAKTDALNAGTGKLRDRLAELEQRAEAATRPFEIEAVSWRTWRELRAEHPPTEEQTEQMLAVGLIAPYNEETFIPAAIAACCKQFSSAEQVIRAAEDRKLTHGQIVALFRAVRALNEEGGSVPPVRGG